MLTSDHVLTRRRGDRLHLFELRPEQRQRALVIAAVYCDAAETCVGVTRAEFEQCCAEVDIHPDDRRLAAGLHKLVTDRCSFAMRADVDPPELRRVLFQRAAAWRRELPATERLDRDSVLAEAGKALDLDTADLGHRLFCDLKSAHLLTEFRSIDAENLLAAWQLGQGQAVLLKSVRVQVEVRSAVPSTLRTLFHKLKFLRLLFVLEALDDGGYRLEIDGPFSLFRSVTKYGLQLAILVPTLDQCCAWQLDAEVIWGRDKRRLQFHLEGGDRDVDPPPLRLADEIATLVARFDKLGTAWRVEPSTQVLHLPGAGLCVPDLLFTHGVTGREVHLEVMGYWSRDAVWRRVELVEAGLPDRILFAVSDRLRVSEKVLDADRPGSLYVYKGVMSAREIAGRLDLLAALP